MLLNGNLIIILFLFAIKRLTCLSYNQPKFCPNATWNLSAITFADNNTIGMGPVGIFIDRNNTVYIPNRVTRELQIWFNGYINVTATIHDISQYTFSLFVTSTGDIYTLTGNEQKEVRKLSLSTNISTFVMNIGVPCYGLFVDINDTIYCSSTDFHYVIAMSLQNTSNTSSIVAGTGCSGMDSYMLSSPRGIFVDVNFDLYVADCNNDRIQLFHHGTSNGKTLAGKGVSGTIILSCPTDVILDADKYLFIADNDNSRIIGSGPDGFRCIVNCISGAGSGPTRLHGTGNIAFDIYGNIFVADYGNSRIQKFLLNSNSCEETTVSDYTITSKSGTNTFMTETTTNPYSSMTAGVTSRSTDVSYNQPKFSKTASWSITAQTFVNRSLIGTYPYGIFVDKNNSVYVPYIIQNQMFILFSNNGNIIEKLYLDTMSINSIFITSTHEIYIDDAIKRRRVSKWIPSKNSSVPILYTSRTCNGLFIDLNNTIYCSVTMFHQIVSKSLNSISNDVKVVAGTGCSTAASTGLSFPQGIFVDTNFDLYVADRNNHRIQLFHNGRLNGITVVGYGASRLHTLNQPNSVVLDADKNLFIADSGNSRIVSSGPNGFRCLVGCFGDGSMANHLNYPTNMMFDRDGNMFVTDRNNFRIQKFFLNSNSCNETIPLQNMETSTINTETSTNRHSFNISRSTLVSYNQPKLSPIATWSANGRTIANSSLIGLNPYTMFINTNNTIFLVQTQNKSILVWFNDTVNSSKIILSDSIYAFDLFVTITGEIYVDNGFQNGRVDAYTLNTNTSSPAMFLNQSCYGIFVDINNVLYCSMPDLHQVVSKSLNSLSNQVTTVAGTGCSGSTSYRLYSPRGIFVDINLDLYVADCGNDRIQRFSNRKIDGITVAGNGTSGSITLNCPTSVSLDADNYLFIVDSGNHRIIGSGPNGFRCLVGCGGGGSETNQLLYPQKMAFDSYGNLFVVDQNNNRIQKFILINTSIVPSYNQPRFCSTPNWTKNATTIIDNTTIRFESMSLFIDIYNKIYIMNQANSEILILSDGNMKSIKPISSNFTSTYSIFVSIAGDIYVDEDWNKRAVKWNSDGNISTAIMSTSRNCFSIFIDITNTIYCSMSHIHQVIKKWLNDDVLTSTKVAGTGVLGSNANELNTPYGIFVDRNLTLYVADCNNDRIQVFQLGQSYGVTIAGNGANGTILLDCPSYVLLDANNFIYILERYGHRIVSSGPNGFRCIIGCSNPYGRGPTQLNFPFSMSFDIYGNIFVNDQFNYRIQKFTLMNPCEMTTSVESQSTTESMTTAIQTSNIQNCSPPTTILIPGQYSSLLSPLEFKRNQDINIVSQIIFHCNKTNSFNAQWVIHNCTNVNCVNQIQLDPNILVTSNEIYIPSRTLDYGIYQLKLILSAADLSNITISSAIYIRITSAGITANLIQLGTSTITIGYQQNLILDPGTYSYDRDGYEFNASNWKYEYYCRIYGLYTFPNIHGLLIPIDNSTIDPFNPPCLVNQTIQYNGISSSRKSSLLITGGSLQLNRTYQFMVHMENLVNKSIQSTGYVLVQVKQISSPIIIIGCVIWAMCLPNLEYQLVNPTTQVALYSYCLNNCSDALSIQWNIYFGFKNSSLNSTTSWNLYQQMNFYENIWFFGRNTSNFTSSDQLFQFNSYANLWKFQVIYQFSSTYSSSSLNFILNYPPSNGSCSINPLNGTTNTLFTISCANWFDRDEIDEYALLVWTNNFNERFLVAYSKVSTFQVRLPPATNRTSLVNLIVEIRDTLNSITLFNLSSIYVTADSMNLSNSVIQLLSTENQNTASQILMQFSKEFNRINQEMIDDIVLSGISMTSISISSLLIPRSLLFTLNTTNSSVLISYNEQINYYSTVREVLIEYLTNLPVTTVNSLKLQSSSLAFLTQSTNQLTRTTLRKALDKCFQLSNVLKLVSTRISYENVQSASNYLLQSMANLLTAVNGPLLQRTNILDLDYSRANAFPDDYDTDIESTWSNLNLFADGNDFSALTIERNRNAYYQKQIANEISIKSDEILSLITSSLNMHLNLEQNLILNTSQVFLSLEKRSMNSLLHQRFSNVKINVSSNLNSSILIRSMIEPLPSFDQSNININLSRTISFSIFDQNFNEISLKLSQTQPIEIVIPRDQNLQLSEMILQNVTALNQTRLFNYHFVNLTNIHNPMSIKIEIEPLNLNLSYLLVYKYDSIPKLNQSVSDINGWAVFCSQDLINRSFYSLFIDNRNKIDRQFLIFGLRELNSTENLFCCLNKTINIIPIQNQPMNFTSNYRLRISSASCLYLDENKLWKVDGLNVHSFSMFEIQCLSDHLTKFTASLKILPLPINWNYVFANIGVNHNKTIYITIIIITLIYFILMIYSWRKDKNDIDKLKLLVLADNKTTDRYKYEIIVFTGHRQGSGTKSNVFIVLSGNNDETSVRHLTTSHRKIFQCNGIDHFLMSVPRSLGSLNYIRIWHDNSGNGSSSSWFLKSIIVRDLQTNDKFVFICQKWFAVEKADGKIERVLPLADEFEQSKASYLLTNTTYARLSDDHLWFSIFARPSRNSFTRVQRCTCCFVLLSLSMFFSILYYDSTATQNQLNSFAISLQQILVGIIVELLSLIPSILLIGFFRLIQTSRDEKRKFYFPTWCLFIAYGISFFLICLSIFFILARGIEFGELKSQKWVISILSSVISSIFLTQPLKILCFTIFSIFLCRKPKEKADFEINSNVECWESTQYKSASCNQIVKRLNRKEIECAREMRLKEIKMWSIIQELILSTLYLTLISFIIYSNRDPNQYLQVKQLKKYFVDSRSTDFNYNNIMTIDDYWNWLEEKFVFKIRAQSWYNGNPPKYLNGFIDDKSNRFIGWATMRQIRVKSTNCSIKKMNFMCKSDYGLFDGDKENYKPGWKSQINANYSLSIENSFKYRSSEELDALIIIGDHQNYEGGGYVYEFRGPLNEIRSNLTLLHKLEWVDDRTRAVIIQMNLYNPNVDLYASIYFLCEFLSNGGVYPQYRFESINFEIFSTIFHLISIIIYFLLIIYSMVIEAKKIFKLKMKYFNKFWSLIQLTLIICSWSALAIHIWRHNETNNFLKRFKETNGSVYINLQLSTYVDNLLTYFYGFLLFFTTIKLTRICRHNRRLSLFSQTLRNSRKELVSFSFMFSIIFISFICLFYLLFVSKILSCSTLLKTCQMLFEMTLLKFESSELNRADPVYGPLCFGLFIIFVVFICISMFISIINDNFRLARNKATCHPDDDISPFMFNRFLIWIGYRKGNLIHYQDTNPSNEIFSQSIDRLIKALDEIYLDQQREENKFQQMTV